MTYLSKAAIVAALMALPVTLWAETTPGIDVSHYQGDDIDWTEVQASGVIFAYAKASEGNTGGDNEFDKNWSAMKAAGVLRGAYEFYIVGDDPATQAQNFIGRVTLEAGDLPPMVDVESANKTAQVNAQHVSDLHSYLDTLKQHYGLAPVIYSNPGFWNANFDDSFGAYPLWVAEYGVSEPKPVTGWETWTLWQHSQSGSVAGISGDVDLNYFNGDASELKKLAKR